MIRKLSAHYIYDGKGNFIKNGILVIKNNGEILELKKPGTLLEENKPEFFDGIITPGFINAHCHLELSHMKNRIEKAKGMEYFIQSVITSRETKNEIIQLAISNADREMQGEGIVAVGDISNNEDSFRVKSKSSIYYHSFAEIFDTSQEGAEEAFKRGIMLKEAGKKKWKIPVSVTPHAAYSVSSNLFDLIRENLNDEENLISVHNQESVYEDVFVNKLTGSFKELFKNLQFDLSGMKPAGKNSLAYLDEVLPLKPNRLFIHNVQTSQEEIISMHSDKEKKFWVLCPRSNQFINGDLPPSFLMQDYPSQICIGTDSLASNTSLSLIEEIKILQNAYKLSLSELLKFITINGARALNIDNIYGSFEKGKKPGVNLIKGIDYSSFMLTPETIIKPFKFRK